MDITKRQLIQTIGGLACFPFTLNMAQADNVDPQKLYISGARIPNVSGMKDSFMVSAFDRNGEEKFSQKLPARGHGLCVSPDGKNCAIFARRPGKFIYILNSHKGTVEAVLKSQPKRKFYGHGQYEPTGRYLFATEKNLDTGAGIISVRDKQQDYKVVYEYSNFGIGPHELVFMPDGKTIAVAVGGIQTKGRKKLNLATMQSSLVYIDIFTGKILDKFSLAKKYFQLSIRHLDVNQFGQVTAVMQYQNSDRDMPLVIVHNGESVLNANIAPPNIAKKMRNYCGSVCYDKSGNYLAVSSPHGDIVTIWATTGALEYLDSFSVYDGCGVAATEDIGTFLSSSGTGGLFSYNVKSGLKKELDSFFAISQYWDNHLISF